MDQRWVFLDSNLSMNCGWCDIRHIFFFAAREAANPARLVQPKPFKQHWT